PAIGIRTQRKTLEERTDAQFNAFKMLTLRGRVEEKAGDGSVRTIQDGTSNSIELFPPAMGFDFSAPSRIHTSTEGHEIAGKQRRESAFLEGFAAMDGEGREVDKKFISDTTKRMEKMEHFLGATVRTPETRFGFGIDPVAKEDSKAETRTGASNKT